MTSLNSISTERLLLNAPTRGDAKKVFEIYEKRLRPIAAIFSWEERRVAWRKICDEADVLPATSQPIEYHQEATEGTIHTHTKADALKSVNRCLPTSNSTAATPR